MAEEERKQLLVTGEVQGIGYRWFARDTALRLGVDGWVRNRPDGSVEIEAQSSPEALRIFEQEISKGHPLAHVVKITGNVLPLKEKENRFTIKT